MQINRARSRWPFVVALIGLLGLCLTIPLCWQSGGKKHEASESSRRRVAMEWPGVKQIDELDGFEAVGKHEAPSYKSIPSLDDLLARIPDAPITARRTGGAAAGHADDEFFADLVLPQTDGTEEPQDPAIPGPYVTAVLTWAGREMADGTPTQLGELVARIVTTIGRGDDRAGSSNALSIRLTDPKERLAMVPPPHRWRSPRTTDQADSTSTIALNPPQPAAIPMSEAASRPSTPWCPPVVLIDRLMVLVNHPYSSHWARTTIDELHGLSESQLPEGDDIAERLARLSALSGDAMQLANAATDDCVRAELLRAHWALERRLECWILMREIAAAPAGTNRFAARVPWESSSDALSGQGTAETAAVDLYSLSDDIESYERIRAPRIARTIIERQRQLAESEVVQERELANRIEQSYRNANIRVALSGELLNRFVPAPQPEMSMVRDRIAGTPVRGQSRTIAENRVKLNPDESRWRLGLESDGTVNSETVADGGQAKVLTHGTTQFTAEKPITVDPNGVCVGRSAAAASTCNQLVGVKTNYDWVPIISEVVRKKAIEEYHRKQPRARAEVEYKVARRVESQLDSRGDDAVSRVEKQVRDRFLGPIDRAGVELTPIEFSTTDKRIVARLRVAGKDQLAGHTPRPRAPADSLASLQVHESAFTNAALTLGLDDKTYTAPELQEMLRSKLPRLSESTPIEVKEDTVFKFADQDAVRFRVAKDRLEIILNMAQVEFEGETVRNFRVHAYYKPDIDGLEADFVRDGALGIEGRLRTGDRARMHGVFNKVLTEDRRLPVVQLTDPNDVRLAGLMITQLVLEDGWIGLAVGPATQGRTAEITRMLR